MQQPAQFLSAPAMPAHSGLAPHPGLSAPSGVDEAELDLGYEGAFPFLTDRGAADAA